MRDKFEAWAVSRQLPLRRDSAGDYWAESTQYAWEGWQAANADAFSAPAAYADPRAFINFEAKVCTHEWMWATPDSGLEPLYRRGELKC